MAIAGLAVKRLLAGAFDQLGAQKKLGRAPRGHQGRELEKWLVDLQRYD